jgi:FtsZ-binding cell division protein ZapB
MSIVIFRVVIVSLCISQEAFSLCDRKILEAVDNVALLQIDTVWSLFMLRDIARLAVARERLKKAREGLLRSHGKNLERLRVLQGGFCPELALCVTCLPFTCNLVSLQVQIFFPVHLEDFRIVFNWEVKQLQMLLI